jgi:UrcA family protein
VVDELEIIMSHCSIVNSFRTALLAGAAGLLLAAAPASAQSYGPYNEAPYAGPADEEVIVTAPRERRFREQWSGTRPLDFPPERVSLSRSVRFDDLDLSTWQGAGELRRRVRHAARAVCGDLREAYPFQRLTTSTPCYRDAVEDGLVRADEAISGARLAIVYRYDDNAYGY